MVPFQERLREVESQLEKSRIRELEDRKKTRARVQTIIRLLITNND